jgi:hypothetical protein
LLKIEIKRQIGIDDNLSFFKQIWSKQLGDEIDIDRISFLTMI